MPSHSELLSGDTTVVPELRKTRRSLGDNCYMQDLVKTAEQTEADYSINRNRNDDRPKQPDEDPAATGRPLSTQLDAVSQVWRLWPSKKDMHVRSRLKAGTVDEAR
jgi:DUF4097 and DUF4098 domain-containing protein YvlB